MKIQNFTDFLISTSVDHMKCSFHDSHAEENNQDCEECEILKEKCEKFQTHNHTFTCAKKNKTITIGTNEGHGRFDGVKLGPELRNIPLCRFSFPKYPMEKTKLILGMKKELNQEEAWQRSRDLKKINLAV